ncbi:Gfo/Idh/MocA family oxidoreductase [Novosphingobium sp.]|uniref:Gfo/Idh/MocA family protein n=1 Tax=Novosphingobium sp. TaxID=1874826 RepID=UPI002624150B|nr:Gfo/Idh/MocA family oxidoreductase [Novosphingobium sp.]
MIRSSDYNRRNFLAQFSSVASLGAVSSWAPWAVQAALAAQSPAANDAVRIGVIGTGRRGRTLLLNLMQAKGCEVVALCDDYAPHLDQAAALMPKPVRRFADYRAMIDAGGLDAVVIATPLHWHARQTLDAFDAGLDVWCEKAMARTIGECRAMVEGAKRKGRVLQIGHQRLFSPTYLDAIQKVRSGAIGTVTQVRASWHRNTSWRVPVPAGSGLEERLNWRLYRKFSGGLMTELATHQIQVANWVFDSAPERVMGSGSICFWKDGRDVYDHVALIFEYSGGRKLVYTSHLNNRRYGAEEQIQGSKGTIEPALGRFYSEAAPPVPGLAKLAKDVANNARRPIPIGGRTWWPELPVTTPGEDLAWGEYDESMLQFEGFADAVRNRQPLPGHLREAYNSSVASLLGEQAMRSGKAKRWDSRMSFPA